MKTGLGFERWRALVPPFVGACVALTFASACARNAIGRGADDENKKERNSGGLATSMNAVASPVSEREAAEVFAALENAIRRIVLDQEASVKPSASASSKKPADRLEIIRQMNRLFELSRPEFKFTPRKVVVDPAVLSVPPGEPERPMLEKLIAFACVGKVSAVATNKTASLDLDEFGDAMGILVSRLADLTHTPSSKWSPYMQGWER